MKKMLLLVFTTFFIYGTSHATTYDFQLEQGEQVAWDGSHVGSGGEFGFSVVSNTENAGYTWLTFCAELEQNIYSANTPITVDGFSDFNTTGSGKLTDTVAWLYWSFSEGSLNNYSGTNGNQKDLQNLIWDGLGYQGYSYRSNQAQNWFDQAAFEVNNGWTNDGRVQIVQFDTSQDVLISGTANNPVPEPTTMALLGFGLIGLAAAGRKKVMRS